MSFRDPEWDEAEQKFAKALQRRMFWRKLCNRLYQFFTGVDVDKLEKARMHRWGL